VLAPELKALEIMISQTSTVQESNRKPIRILVGGFFHETHTFLNGTTQWNAFRVIEGNAIHDVAGDASPLGGFLEFSTQRKWEIVPAIVASAIPSAILADETLEEFWKRFEKVWLSDSAKNLDAVYLVLHGAAVTQSCSDAEGEILKRIRFLPGGRELPIFGVYDLHANYSKNMAKYADGLVGYRENPHIDARESAIRAAELLERSIRRNQTPKQFLVQSSIVWPPTGTGTAYDPMRLLLTRARQMENENHDFWAINVNAGFAFADSIDTRVSFSVITEGSESDALTAMNELNEIATANADKGVVLERSMDSVMEELRQTPALNGAMIANHGPPIILIEPSDNVGAGAPGDGTGILRLLLKYELVNSAVCLWDPNSVAQLRNVAIGDLVNLELGGRGSPFDLGPVSISCKLLRLSDGHFELEDKQSHLASVCGNRFDMGQCAVVEHNGVTILLTSNRTPPMDLGQWKHMGIEPKRLSFIGVKAAVAHRRAYDPIARASFLIETPGPCQSRLTAFPYKHLRRPIYPLDSLPLAIN